MDRFAQFLGSEGINVSLSSVDYDPYTQLNYLFKLDGEYVDDQITKKLDPEIQALEKIIEESVSTGQFTCVTAGDPTITIGGTTIAPTVAVNTACFSNCQGTVTSVTGGTGIDTSGCASSPAISLTNTGVSAGSYTSTNITVDAQGRITAASNGSGGGGGAGVANVTASHGLSSSGGTEPNITIAPAQTDITSIKNTALNVGRDNDNLIKFNTDNEIVFEVGGTDGVTFKCAGEIEASCLDISGNVDIDGALETDALSLSGALITRTAAQINAARPGTVTSVCKGDDTITIGGTATNPTVAVNSACFTDCEGTVTCVAAGTGLSATSGITPVISIDATQSSLSSIKNSCLVVGRDNANFIQFATNNQIAFYVASCDGVIFKNGGEIKACCLDISGVTDIAGTLSLAGTDIDASATEINQIHGITDGTVAANKAVIVDGNRDITGFRNITLTGELDTASLDVEGNADINGTLETNELSLNGTLITRTAAQINAARPGTVTCVSNSDGTITIGGGEADPIISVNTACFTDCEGTVCSVGLSGIQGIDIIAGSPVTGCGTICLKVSDACNTAWNAKTTCTGTVCSAGLALSASACCTTLGVKDVCNYAWNAKTTCTGTVCSAGIALSADASGTTLGVKDACNYAWNAKTTCTGTVCSAGLALSASACGTTLGVNDACNYAWNAKTTCTGTVGSVGLSGTQGIDIISVDPITQCGTICLKVSDACNTKWNQSACNGTVTCITTTGAYLTGGSITCTGNIGLDYNCAASWDAKTTCTGTVCSAGLALSASACGTTLGVNDACNYAWNAKTTCTGTVDSVGLSGTQGIDIIAGSPVTGCGTICLKIDNTCNTAWNAKTTCTGTVCSAGLALSASACCTTLGVNDACNYAWNAKTTCTGTVCSAGLALSADASGTTLGVKDVCNYAWNSKTTCTGTVCSAGLALSASACGTTLGVNDACNYAWNAKTTCEGTVTSVNCGDSTITIGGTVTDPTIAVNTACFTNCEGTVCSAGLALSASAGGTTLGVKDVCNTAWNAKTTCEGTVTSVNCGDSTITIGGTVTDPTIAVNSACFTDCEGTVCGAGIALSASADGTTLGVKDLCNYAWNAKTTCTGTVDSVAISGTQGITVVNGSPITQCGTINLKIADACNTAWNAKTTCTGTVCGAGIALSASADGTTLGVKDVCNYAWNAKTTCTGTVTSVNCGDSTISIGGTATAPTIAVNSACFTDCEGTVTSVSGSNDTIVISGTTTAPTLSVNELCFSNCQGTVTCVTGGDGLTGNITTSGNLAVDTSVARTNIDEVFSCDLTVQGDLTVTGDITCLETIISTTSALSVTNSGTGPALVVNQTGSNDIIDFRDDNNSVFYIEDGGNIGLGTTDPNYKLDVTGDINSQNHILSSGVNLDTLFLTEACNGTVTCIDVSGGICGGPITTSGTLSIDTACNTKWDQSTCPGINATGTVQSITTTGVYLTGGTITSTGNIGINYNCATSWDAKTTCTGTVNCLSDLGITTTAAKLNFSSNVTSDIQAQLNASCDKTTCTGTVSALSDLGITATAEELNYTTNVCADIQTQLNDKIPSVGSTSITTLGTIGTGTWQGTAIADTYIASASDWNACATSTQGTAADNALPKAGGDMSGNLTIAKTDPTITLFDNSGVNTDPNGTIIFSEASGVTNFDINYNGSDDRLEFRGRIGSTLTDLVYINRSSGNAINVNGNIIVTGTVDGRDIAADGSKLDDIACGAEVNVQSNWNASSGDALILNKPTIPTDNNELCNGCNYTTCTGTVSALSDLGITATAAELNYTTNVCADIQTQLNDKSPTAGSTSITTVGTIGTGTWQGTAIADTYIASASDWNACATSTQGTAADNALPKAGGTMCGNIVMGSDDITFTAGGTVDGRDVSADGAKLDDIACGAEVNVQSNWNASSGDALILNKPTIPTDNSELCNGCNYTTCTGTVSALGDLGITTTAAKLNFSSNVCADIQTQLNDKSPTAGSTSITTVGTIGTGTWQGTKIADAYIASASDWNACATSTQGTAADNALPKAGGDMSGNIVMAANDITFTAGGTVDGRDVSADGAKLDGIACGAEVNVQSNWNASSGDALILNKPTIPTNNNQLTNGCNYGTGTVCSLGDLGITATAAELNYTTNVTSDIQAQLDAKGTGTVCSLGDLGITATAAELNYTTNVTSDIQAQLDASCSKTTCTGNICSSTAQCIYDSDENFCLGSNAGEDLTSGIRNTMLGKCAGRCITTGQNNIAIGYRAQEKNCEQNYNTALGFCSMFCGGGCGNAAIGQQAMQNSTADNSVAIGKCTLRSATGNSNTAIGAQALQGMTSGENNFGLGAIAGFALQTGNSNVFIGQDASRYKVSGNNDVAIGKRAGRCYASGNRTSGADNIFIGQDTKAGTNGGSNEIVIGCGAVGQGTNTAMIGNSSTTHLYIYGCYSTVSDRRDKTCICDLELGLEFIKELKPKTFNTIADRCDPTGSITGKKHGFIAQDIIALEGEDNVIVSNKNPDRLSYTGEHIIPILVKGMQEQQLVIDNLASEVKDLKNKLESL